jgi:NADH-quinone oxidoreductase subunit M
LLILLGVYPKPALDVIEPAVAHTMTTIDQQDPVPAVDRTSPIADGGE